MSDYPTFLAARLDELEGEPGQIEYELSAAESGADIADYLHADVETKRDILADYRSVTQVCQNLQHNLKLVPVHEAWKKDSWTGELRRYLNEKSTLQRTIKTLCRPFADHPDHPKET